MSVITTVRCRISQSFIALGRKTKSLPTQMVEQGPESLFLLPQILRSHRLRKPLVVMRPNQSWGDKLCAALGENDMEYAVWDVISPLPTADEGENIRLYWLGESCDSIIALGDGAVIDIAKAAAVRAAGRSRSIMDMVGRDRVTHRRRVPPVIAIPTVGGSCAEALAAATVYDDRGHGFLLEDRALIPPYVILDPALLEDGDRQAIAAAGINGLCYSVEAYLSGYSDEQTRTTAAMAVSGFLNSVEACWNKGGTPEYRATLLEASQLGGTAASRGGTGYVRALCRSVVNVTGKEFSAVCGALLPLVLENYGPSGVEKLGELAQLAGVSDAGSRAERAEALIERIRGMAFRIGLPENLEGLDEQSILEICDLAAAEANPYCSSPVVWTAQQCAQVLMKNV